jgi:hypothetical protein
MVIKFFPSILNMDLSFLMYVKHAYPNAGIRGKLEFLNSLWGLGTGEE